MSQNRTYNVAIVGATGAVGEQMLNMLANRNFPINELNCFLQNVAQEKKLPLKDKEYTVEEANTRIF